MLRATCSQALIQKEPVLVFSKTHCPHCAKVKALFKELKTDFELVELDERGALSLVGSWLRTSCMR